MHDGMQYDPIPRFKVMVKTQALESWKSFHFQKLFSLSFTMEAGN